MGDNNILQTIGSIFVEAIVEGKINHIYIKDVLHVPKLHAKLLFVSKLMLNNLNVQFNLDEYIIKFYNCANRTIVEIARNTFHA